MLLEIYSFLAGYVGDSQDLSIRKFTNQDEEEEQLQAEEQVNQQEVLADMLPKEHQNEY